ncbi:hypothetical protein [Enterococcus rivorum]|uniref:hypothetical protein n=1 Tax=Enterococcus rivorum TaxID=762845 RepID=UPI001FD9AE70|nr:hypothetical protein [Enterococcus rivorum]MBP2098840.1 hypothetical protein [Enterococcus rivorum]
MMKYTEAQKKFIREIAPGRYNDEIAAAFNKKFGLSITPAQIKNYKNNHKIKSGTCRRRKNTGGIFTLEQQDFIRDNVKNRSNQELTDLLN